MSRSRLRRALKAVRDYVRYDLREIVAPRSLPDPPGRVLPKRLTLKDYWQVHKLASAKELCGPGAQEEPGKAGAAGTEQPDEADRPGQGPAAPAPRSGAEALKALLTQLYQTRAAAYRDSVRAFIEGYAEGRAAPPASWEDALGPQPGAQAPAAPSGLSTSETGGAGAPPGRAAGRAAGGAAGSSGAASAAGGGGPAGAGRGGAAGAAGGESAQGSEAAAACDDPGAASPSGAGAASGVRQAAGGDDRAAVPPHAGGRPGRGERQAGGAAGTSADDGRLADSGAGGATGAHADAELQRHNCAGQAASERREQEPPCTAAK